VKTQQISRQLLMKKSLRLLLSVFATCLTINSASAQADMATKR
jgi:hypothetical protein